MDISKASNFERFMFDLLGRDAARVAALFRKVETHGGFDLSGGRQRRRRIREGRAVRLRVGQVACTRTGWRRYATCMTRYGVTIDTHTADGVKVAREYVKPGVTMIVLETALPAKFNETIQEALGPRRRAAGRLREHRSRCRSVSW